MSRWHLYDATLLQLVEQHHHKWEAICAKLPFSYFAIRNRVMRIEKGKRAGGKYLCWTCGRPENATCD